MKKQTNKGFNQLYAFGDKSLIDLSLSENPLGCSRFVKKRLKEIFPKLSDYPDPRKTRLKKALADKFNLQASSFFIGNGSESIIIDLSRALLKNGDHVIIPKLSFPMFEISSKLVGASVINSKMTADLEISLDSILEKITNKTKMIFICNPNNPTGNVISKSRLLSFLKSVSKGIFVILDEANIEFGGSSLIKEVKNFNNLVILRTFSKGFGLAALRVGFCVASEAVQNLLSASTQPFPVSSISEELVIVALNDQAFLDKTKAFVNSQRKIMVRELKLLNFKVFPSRSNNLFVKIPDSLDQNEFFQRMKDQNISVVKGSSFSGFNDSFFRVSPRGILTNKIFIKKIKDIVGN
ncbi:aminotransferase class I/II-fold pyridoxal phosphate-dependent enzyme [Patescibacteria group bacterium]|nr:aminotransferase class I/II-fold pyridoxal phosphate-dependent enzyme [Patescibacteria group bacterium]